MTLILWAIFAIVILNILVLLWAYVLGRRIERREAAERTARQLARVHPPEGAVPPAKPTYFVPDGSKSETS
jgi:uncharacterized membrane protein